MQRSKALAIILAAFLEAGGARAEPGPFAPEGQQFQVNTYTTEFQYYASVAADPAGAFVVVWTSYQSPGGQDGNDRGLFGQRYSSSGTPLGGEFQINTYTTNPQYTGFTASTVSADGDGDFIVVWTSRQGSRPGQDGENGGIYAQRYASSGTPLGGELQVNTYTPGWQYAPTVRSDPQGNFVVLWASPRQDGSEYGVFGQRYASSGAAQGGEFRVNTYTTNTQDFPSLAIDTDGDFVVVWQSGRNGSPGADGAEGGISGQRFASSGAPRGGEFQINAYATGRQYNPFVSAGEAGDFVVVWAGSGGQPGLDEDSDGIFGQRFASSGAPLGGQFRVNTTTSLAQREPAVQSDAEGNFAVAWLSNGQDGSDNGIFGQHFASSGERLGRELQVNSYTPGSQRRPAIALVPMGMIVTWESDGSGGTDASGPSVQAQRFGPAPPTPSVTPKAVSILVALLCSAGLLALLRRPARSLRP